MKVSLHGDGSSESVVEPPARPSRKLPPFAGAALAARSHKLVAVATVMAVAAARVTKSRRVSLPMRGLAMSSCMFRSPVFRRIPCAPLERLSTNRSEAAEQILAAAGYAGARAEKKSWKSVHRRRFDHFVR